MYVEDCPHWITAHERLLEVAAERGVEVEHLVVGTPREAEAFGFRGSPTILVEGRDPFARGDEACGLSCRLYETPDGPAGSPTLEQLRKALDG
jgi:hypothetical protein